MIALPKVDKINVMSFIEPHTLVATHIGEAATFKLTTYLHGTKAVSHFRMREYFRVRRHIKTQSEQLKAKKLLTTATI